MILGSLKDFNAVEALAEMEKIKRISNPSGRMFPCLRGDFLLRIHRAEKSGDPS